LVARSRPIDLLVGSALFRDSFVDGGPGHVDLPRARDGGYGVIGLTVATTWPDVSGSLSRWHFRSLGLPGSAVGSRMAIANSVIDRAERWCADSRGGLVIVRSVGDLERCLASEGPVGVLLGVQGAHVLDGDLANIERLRVRGVRMFAPAHVMDNDVVGSGTGRAAGGLSSYGMEVITELEAQGLIVDLAHMSDAGLEQTMPLLTRPFVLSHSAIRDEGARPGRLRRYSAATRNVPESVVREVGARGGLFGVVMATQLLGGATLNSAVRMIRRALDAAGDGNVAIGSDMDGALKMLIDCEGLPALADTMLAAGLSETVVSDVIGSNAARFLRSALPA
jgi:microsomal dipeptidase-like Zn-dependent dipeptidase